MSPIDRLRGFWTAERGALQALEFLLVLTFAVLPVIYAVRELLAPALVEYLALEMRVLTSPLF